MPAPNRAGFFVPGVTERSVEEIQLGRISSESGNSVRAPRRGLTISGLLICAITTVMMLAVTTAPSRSTIQIHGLSCSHFFTLKAP